MYKRQALFRGEAFIVFCISVIMAAIVAYAYGPTSQLCLYVLMCVGAEGALLSQKRKNILFFIPFILIAVELIGYKLYPQYLGYVTMAGEALALLLMMIGTVGYFVHNPYRKDRKNIKAAKSDLKELHLSLIHISVYEHIRLSAKSSQQGEIHRVQIVRFVRGVYFALKRRGLV